MVLEIPRHLLISAKLCLFPSLFLFSLKNDELEGS